MPERDIAKTRQLGTPEFWKRAQERARRAERRSMRRIQIREWGHARLSDGKAIRGLVANSIAWLLVTLGVLAALELVALFARPAIHRYAPAVAGAMDVAQVSGLIGICVAAEATLLGLYYATVGIVASTVYKDVPGQVRDLFMQEQTGRLYTRTIVLAIVAGIATLTANAFGYRVSRLTLGVLALAAAFVVLWLAYLGQRLFRFFDPTALTSVLIRRLQVAIDTASDSATATIASQQRNALAAAVQAIGVYLDIASILEGSTLKDAHAPMRINWQLLNLAGYYSARKDVIPTDSQWWVREAEHPNWLTLDQTRLQMALETSSGVEPTHVPNPLWLEVRIAQILRISLGSAINLGAGGDVLGAADTATAVEYVMASRLQIREALARALRNPSAPRMRGYARFP